MLFSNAPLVDTGDNQAWFGLIYMYKIPQLSIFRFRHRKSTCQRYPR